METDTEDEEEASLAEPPGPQERVPQRTVEPMLETFVPVPSLDVPVPQMENQLVEPFRYLDLHVPEQAIKVPKISIPSLQAPCALRGADGRTVGGSADDHLRFFPIAADCGAERRCSSSSSWRAKRRSSRFSSQTEFNCAACFSGTQF